MAAELRLLNRSTVITFGVLLVGVALFVTGAYLIIAHDREELIERFTEEREEQVLRAAGAAEDDIQDMVDDLDLARRLLADSSTIQGQRRILETLLGSVDGYRAAAVYRDDRSETTIIKDPRDLEGIPSELIPPMIETAHKALVARAFDGVVPSLPVGIDDVGWFRVFATALPPESPGGHASAIALLVDTRSLLEKLHLAASGPLSQLLILGPYGGPVPEGASVLADIVERIPKGSEKATPYGELEWFAALLSEMRSGQKGSTRLTENEAVLIGLDPGEVIVSYAPIRMPGGSNWSIALFTSLSRIRSHEEAIMWQAIMWRFGLASVIFALALLGFGTYVVVASWRAATLSARLKDADELAKLREKAEKILENIPTSVMLLSDSGRVTSMNRALRAHVPSAAVGNDLETALPAASVLAVGRVRGLVERARSSGSTQSLLAERLTLFGAEGHYSVHAVPLQPHSPDARVLLVIEDLTDVTALESHLLRAEKLATVGVLAAGIAHEIGTPLGVVRGRAEQVLGKVGREHPQAPALKVIIDQIDRVARTIRALLDFSRVQPAAVTPIALAPMTKRIVELVRFEAERRKLSVDVDIPEGLPQVAADPDQLQQVLLNLVMNALDASSPGGKVTIAAARAGDHEIPKDRIRMEIIDQGCGIPDENRHRVFDPFFTTKKRGQGTGLGLTVVSQIARSHGADFELESRPGHGTRAILHWPRATSRGEEAPCRPN